MELSELAAYAEEKYHMKEEHKWADFPGFSVLADPVTNKWVALLMRQWDYERGCELQRCDIKCGRDSLSGLNAPYVTGAFRMKGKNWVGVIFDGRTDPEVVFGLFDRAVRLGNERGYTIVLEGENKAGSSYSDTLLPLESMRGNYDRRRVEEHRAQNARAGRLRAEKQRPEKKKVQHRSGIPTVRLYAESQGPAGAAGTAITGKDQIPPRILEMMRLYVPGDGSFENKCRNFYRQGKFMEDYEDDAPWGGEFKRYFATYHDLNLRQLRGYFAWRAHVRSGDFNRIATSFAYMYLYELLNGIGAESPGETLRKMKEFEAGYLDGGIGDPAIRPNLHRWMMEFAVLSGSSLEEVLPFLDPGVLARDRNLAVLRRPQVHGDEEIYGALNALTGGKTEKSPVLAKEPERGSHLFAQVWRYMSEHYMDDGWDIFTACFGERKRFPFRPLANAVYVDRAERGDAEYEINECRKYVYESGSWFEERYDDLYFDKYRIHAVMHEADRQLRRYLKTGHYLRAKQGEEWITPYVEAVIEADSAAIEEAARPRITIDLSGLDRIRRDAQITRDSLLTEEERTGRDMAEEKAMESAAGEAGAPDVKPATEFLAWEAEAAAAEPCEELFGGVENKLSDENEQTSVRNMPDCAIIEIPSLDEVHGKILLSLMRGEPVSGLIRDNHLMPSVVTDSINEALFDEIGDNVLECDGEEIILVEDYREDLDLIFGGYN